jgi:hypothetical protein
MKGFRAVEEWTVFCTAELAARKASLTNPRYARFALSAERDFLRTLGARAS